MLSALVRNPPDRVGTSVRVDAESGKHGGAGDPEVPAEPQDGNREQSLPGQPVRLVPADAERASRRRDVHGRGPGTDLLGRRYECGHGGGPPPGPCSTAFRPEGDGT